MVGDPLGSLGLEFEGSSGVIKTWRVMLGSERVGRKNVRVLLMIVEEYFLMGLVGGKRIVGAELFPSNSDSERGVHQFLMIVCGARLALKSGEGSRIVEAG